MELLVPLTLSNMGSESSSLHRLLLQSGLLNESRWRIRRWTGIWIWNGMSETWRDGRDIRFIFPHAENTFKLFVLFCLRWITKGAIWPEDLPTYSMRPVGSVECGASEENPFYLFSLIRTFMFVIIYVLLCRPSHYHSASGHVLHALCGWWVFHLCYYERCLFKEADTLHTCFFSIPSIVARVIGQSVYRIHSIQTITLKSY